MIFYRHERGLKLVAVFEAVKGGVVLAIGLGLLSLRESNPQQVAERVARRLHLNPASHFPKLLLDGIAQLDDSWLWLLSAISFAYALFRFVEAYGLWRMRRWGEWLALVSAGLYVPMELYELMQRLTWIRVMALVINLALVAYLIWMMRQQKRAGQAPVPSPEWRPDSGSTD